MFLVSSDKVYIVDKVEGNPSQINGHPQYAAVWLVVFPSGPYGSLQLSVIQGHTLEEGVSPRYSNQRLLCCWHAPP